MVFDIAKFRKCFLTVGTGVRKLFAAGATTQLRRWLWCVGCAIFWITSSI